MLPSAREDMQTHDSEAHREATELQIIAETLPLDEARVLELGCGRAWMTRRIAEDFAVARVIATEVDRIQHQKEPADHRPAQGGIPLRRRRGHRPARRQRGRRADAQVAPSRAGHPHGRRPERDPSRAGPRRPRLHLRARLRRRLQRNPDACSTTRSGARGRLRSGPAGGETAAASSWRRRSSSSPPATTRTGPTSRTGCSR